jgi:hypothetical protein
MWQKHRMSRDVFVTLFVSPSVVASAGTTQEHAMKNF